MHGPIDFFMGMLHLQQLIVVTTGSAPPASFERNFSQALKSARKSWDKSSRRTDLSSARPNSYGLLTIRCMNKYEKYWTIVQTIIYQYCTTQSSQTGQLTSKDKSKPYDILASVSEDLHMFTCTSKRVEWCSRTDVGQIPIDFHAWVLTIYYNHYYCDRFKCMTRPL